MKRYISAGTKMSSKLLYDCKQVSSDVDDIFSVDLNEDDIYDIEKTLIYLKKQQVE